MRVFKLLTFVLASCQLAGLTAQAQWWNPMDWFDGDDGEVEQRNDILPVLQPPSPEDEARAETLFAEAEALQADGRTRAARQRYRKIFQDYPRTLPAPEAQFRVAKMIADKGNIQRAFKLAQRTIRRYPDFEGFNRIIGEQFSMASQILDREGRWLYFIPAPKPLNRARQYFEQVVANAPYSDYAPLALMNIAIIAEKQNRPSAGIDALDRLISFYPDNLLTPDAYFMLAEIHADLVAGAYYDQGATRQAISYYEDFLVLYPEDNAVPAAEEGLDGMQEVLARSKFILGDFYHRYRKNEPAALVFYNEAITLAPEAASSEQARARIASIEAGEDPPSYGFGLGKLWQRIGNIGPLGRSRDKAGTLPENQAGAEFLQPAEQ